MDSSEVFPVLLLFNRYKRDRMVKAMVDFRRTEEPQSFSFGDDLTEGACITASVHIHAELLVRVMKLQSLGRLQDGLVQLWQVCHSVLQLWHKANLWQWRRLAQTHELCI